MGADPETRTMGNAVAMTGVVLAGGRSQRMGGTDKGLLDFRGRPLARYALDAVALVAEHVMISANRNLSLYAEFGYPVVPDDQDGFLGPLAGLLGIMKRAPTARVLTVPCDCPLMTGTMLQRLPETFWERKVDAVVAHDGSRLQPTFLIVNCSLMADLEGFLRAGERKLSLWLARHRFAVADYSDRPDLFLNVNSPEDLIQLEARWDSLRSAHPNDSGGS
jgi:molybdopterin-guanine dinucleotide biosynthesis protein A